MTRPFAEPRPSEPTSIGGGSYLALGAMCLWPVIELAQSSPSISTPPEKPGWSSFLPIWKAEPEKRGHELPLPFGLSVIAMGLNELHKVTDLRLGEGPGTPQSVLESLLVVSPVEMNAWSTTMRGDVWVLL